MSWSDFLLSFCRAPIQLLGHTRTSTCLHDRLGESRISQVHCVSLSTCDALKLRWCLFEGSRTAPKRCWLPTQKCRRPPHLEVITKLKRPKDFADRPYRLLISLCTLHLYCSIKHQESADYFRSFILMTSPPEAQHSVRGGEIPLLDGDLHPARIHNASWRSPN
jgi:hypothetical protein